MRTRRRARLLVLLGTGVLALAAERHPGGFELVDTPAVLRGITREPLPLAEGALHAQLWPHRHGTDAMFIQLLRRSPA